MGFNAVAYADSFLSVPQVEHEIELIKNNAQDGALWNGELLREHVEVIFALLNRKWHLEHNAPAFVFLSR